MNVHYDDLKTQKVHPVDRYMAKGLDMIIMAIVGLILQLVLWSPLAVLIMIMYALFHDGLNAGESPGKRIIGLRVVKLPNHGPITWKDSAKRNILFGLIALFSANLIPGFILLFLIGIPLLIYESFLIYNLESGYRLGDILAGTQVISNRQRVQEHSEEQPRE